MKKYEIRLPAHDKNNKSSQIESSAGFTHNPFRRVKLEKWDAQSEIQNGRIVISDTASSVYSRNTTPYEAVLISWDNGILKSDQERIRTALEENLEKVEYVTTYHSEQPTR